jgi:hypothetical protein
LGRNASGLFLLRPSNRHPKSFITPRGEKG